MVKAVVGEVIAEAAMEFVEAQVKAEQQLKYPKPGEKGLKPIDGYDEIASNDLSDLRKETIFSFLVSCLPFFDVGVSIR